MSVTLIDVAPSTTWLLVSTSPLDLSTMPVPKARSFALSVVSTSTIFESTPLAIAAAFAEFASAHPGILIENKGHSIALHYRGAPQDREAARTLAECLVAAAGPGLQLLPARLAIDIKARLVSKGSAIDWFMDRPPFRGRIPTFLGDDRTDEDGFVAVDARGGHSVHVGDGFDSVARFRLGSPRDVRRWLGQEARRRGPAAASIRQSR